MRRHSDSWLDDRRARNVTFRSSDIIVDSYRLILLPVWLAHYRWEGRPYDIAVNGQNEDVYGQRPARSWRDWLKNWFNLGDGFFA